MQKNTNQSIAIKLEEMDIEDLAKYINNSIKKYGSLKRACDQIGVKKDMLKRIFNKNKYKYDEASHEFVENSSENEIIVNPSGNDNVGGTLSIQSLQDPQAQDYLLQLINNQSDIMKMLNEYRDGKLGIPSTPQIIEIKNFIEIDLPESKNKKTSIWVNDKVWEDFKSFNKKHKEFSNADLISMALKSYMEKYEGI